MSSSTARSLAHLPRSLKLSAQTTITRTHLLALYREQLRIANSFDSYNFKQFFVRKTQDKFRRELPSLLLSSPSSSATPSLPPSTTAAPPAATSAEPEPSDSIYAPTTSTSAPVAQQGTTPEERLRDWYADALTDLGVLARAAIVNRLYEAPRLVVELPKPTVQLA
ncbi:hypothetical protein RQP46_005682 [Phenoliferia psychrophenolica]